MVKRIQSEQPCPSALCGWYPVVVDEAYGEHVVTWRRVGRARFTEPFFEDTLRSIPHVEREIRRSSVDALHAFSRLHGADPSAFVFHASRSGSTLVAQLLATLRRCIVISEAPPIDAALTLTRRHRAGRRSREVVQSVVRAFGQKRFGEEEHLIVKLDSWHIAYFPLLRGAFPDTPCFYVYREPMEIAASHRSLPGLQMVPGFLDPDFFELASASIPPGDLDTYRLCVLASFFRSASRYAEQGELIPVEYKEMPDAVWNVVAARCGLSLDEREIRVMQRRCRQHSKRPGETFDVESDAGEADAERRRAADPSRRAGDGTQRESTSEAYAEALRDAEFWYETLERLRTVRADAFEPGLHDGRSDAVQILP